MIGEGSMRGNETEEKELATQGPCARHCHSGGGWGKSRGLRPAGGTWRRS